MFTEEALGEFPVGLEGSAAFHQGVYPVDSAANVLVFDAVAAFRVVFHDLTGAAAAVDVDLEEDDVTALCHAEAVFVYQAKGVVRSEDGREKACKGALILGVD